MAENAYIRFNEMFKKIGLKLEPAKQDELSKKISKKNEWQRKNEKKKKLYRKIMKKEMTMG